jgi:hypothetical protein
LDGLQTFDFRMNDISRYLAIMRTKASGHRPGLMKRANLGAVFCSIVVIATLPSCKKQAQLSLTAMPKSAVGQYSKFTVEKVEQCEANHKDDPKKGFIRLGVEGTFEGITEEAVYVPDINESYPKITDSNGDSYRGTSVGCQPWFLLPKEGLKKDQKARGWITFDVPEAASGLKFSVRPRLSKDASSPNHPWAVAVYDKELSFDLSR